MGGSLLAAFAASLTLVAFDPGAGWKPDSGTEIVASTSTAVPTASSENSAGEEAAAVMGSPLALFLPRFFFLFFCDDADSPCALLALSSAKALPVEAILDTLRVIPVRDTHSEWCTKITIHSIQSMKDTWQEMDRGRGFIQQKNRAGRYAGWGGSASASVGRGTAHHQGCAALPSLASQPNQVIIRHGWAGVEPWALRRVARTHSSEPPAASAQQRVPQRVDQLKAAALRRVEVENAYVPRYGVGHGARHARPLLVVPRDLGNVRVQAELVPGGAWSHGAELLVIPACSTKRHVSGPGMQRFRARHAAPCVARPFKSPPGPSPGARLGLRGLLL